MFPDREILQVSLLNGGYCELAFMLAAIACKRIEENADVEIPQIQIFVFDQNIDMTDIEANLNLHNQDGWMVVVKG